MPITLEMKLYKSVSKLSPDPTGTEADVSSLSSADDSVSGVYNHSVNRRLPASNPLDEDISTGYLLHSKTLSEGLFGKVRIATHIKSSQHVVVKIVNKKRFRNELDMQMVQTEISSLKVLHHNNIARLLQLIETDEQFFIIREYCSNGDLFDYVVKQDRLHEKDARTILRDLTRCLDYIHERGFSHRDIRPENILLDAQFRIKLIGFRFAHIRFDTNSHSTFDYASTKTNDVIAEYSPPEVVTGSRITDSTAIDIWSSGVVLYFMLTGRLPFADESLARLFRKIEAGVFELPSDLSDDVCQLLVQMLKVNPMERASVKQVLTHRWMCHPQQCDLYCGSLGLSGSATIDTTADWNQYENDKLDDTILSECFELHRAEVQDMVELRYNIRYKFCYQTATYWLVKENYDRFKRFASDKGNKLKSSQIRRRHTVMEPRNPSKLTRLAVNPKRDEKSTIRRQLGTSMFNLKCKLNRALEEQAKENKKKRTGSIFDDFIVKVKSDKCASPNRGGWSSCQSSPVKKKAMFNLGKIFSKSSLMLNHSGKSDPQLTPLKSIANDLIENVEDDDDDDVTSVSDEKSASSRAGCKNGDGEARRGVAGSQRQSKASSLFNKSLPRKLSFIGLPNKLLNGRDLSRINSASTVYSDRTGSTNNCHWQSGHCSTTGGDSGGEQRVHSVLPADGKQSLISSNSKKNPFRSALNLRYLSGEETSSEGNSGLSSHSSSGTNHSGEEDAVDGHHQKKLSPKGGACDKINGNETGKKRNKSSTVAIITRYDNYEECRRAAHEMLSRKGINCKSEKNKLRCCVSAMNTVIVAFQLKFHTFPSMNRGNFVLIEVKLLRGNLDDFNLICTDLTRHFERSRAGKPAEN